MKTPEFLKKEASILIDKRSSLQNKPTGTVVELSQDSILYASLMLVELGEEHVKEIVERTLNCTPRQIKELLISSHIDQIREASRLVDLYPGVLKVYRVNEYLPNDDWWVLFKNPY